MFEFEKKTIRLLIIETVKNNQFFFFLPDDRKVIFVMQTLRLHAI